MSGAKILVVSMKEIIRTALFAIAGIALIILLIYLFIPKDKGSQANLYVPGEYTSELVLHNGSANISVTVDDKSILSITAASEDENVPVFYPLLNPTIDSVGKQIVDNQSTDATNITSDTTNVYTTRIVLDAVNNALNKATSS